MYRLRGALLPLVRLDELLERREIAVPGSVSTREDDSDTNIVVLAAEGGSFGLIVEEILDTSDIVVKPLSPFLKSLQAFSGATIMGDGSVSLILDVAGIAARAHLSGGHRDKDEGLSEILSDRKVAHPDAQEFLLFGLGQRGKHGIPLCLVQRLEEFDAASIERSGEQRVVRYRQSILPLFALGSSLGYAECGLNDGRPTQNVIVIQRSGRLYGLVVDEILDIVTVHTSIDDSLRDRDSLLGNLLHQDDVIVVIDALRIVEIELARLSGADPESRSGGRTATGASGSPGLDSRQEIERLQREQNHRVRILFAEDVAFFRRQVAKVLSGAGYEVVLAENGAAALRALQASRDGDINMVISDIEMPEMTGLELARSIRGLERFKGLPLIALTTRFRDSDVREGKQAGFDLYLEKLNEDRLLRSIEAVLRGPESPT